MDGGVGANNPAFRALNEARQMAERENKSKSVAALISVGTGQKAVETRFGRLPVLPLLSWARKLITNTTEVHDIIESDLSLHRK